MRRPLTTLTAVACLALATPTLAQSAQRSDATPANPSCTLRRQAPLHDDDHAARAGGDPRLRVRRQGVLGRLRRPEPRLRQAGQGWRRRRISISSPRVAASTPSSSRKAAPNPDLKVFVRPDATVVAPMGPPRFYSTSPGGGAPAPGRDGARRTPRTRGGRWMPRATPRRRTTDEQVKAISRACFRRSCGFPIDSRLTNGPSMSPPSLRTARSPTSGPTRPSCRRCTSWSTPALGVPAPNLVNFQVERGVYMFPRSSSGATSRLGSTSSCSRRRADRRRSGMTEPRDDRTDEIPPPPAARRRFGIDASRRAASSRGMFRCG